MGQFPLQTLVHVATPPPLPFPLPHHPPSLTPPPLSLFSIPLAPYDRFLIPFYPLHCCCVF